jgi:GMP synthase-like glutamine amidotransferase
VSEILVVQHEPSAPAARMGDALIEAGLRLDIRRPYLGDPLPEPDELHEYAGLLVLGGAMDAWDDVVTPWLPHVRALVVVAETTGVPTLGICLGHQLATLALGGSVSRNPGGTTLAVLPVGWTTEAADDPLSRDVGPALGVHWNNDVALRLPDGARVLARSPDGHVQAARLGEHVWGVQFHPEAGPELVARWVDEDGDQFAAAGLDVERYLHDARTRGAELDKVCRRLAVSFAALLRGVPR